MAKRVRVRAPVSDRDWRARSDAHTLIEAQKINDDPKRLAAAKKAIKAIVEESREALAATLAVQEEVTHGSD